MNLLFIYRNAAGTIKVEEIEAVKLLEDDCEWQHIATIEPKLFLENMLNVEPRIVERWMK
jgi:hypothetical protein